jgi:hypothetical protein
MILRERSFPHPVLSPLSDDVTPSGFALALSHTADADRYYFDVKFDHQNETIAQLVRDARAEYVVHLECKRNFFREIFPLAEPQGRSAYRPTELPD